jgi:hypothetical protein
MVIQAVIEDIGLKQRIFVNPEASCAPHTTHVAAPVVCVLPLFFYLLQAAWAW